MPGVLECLERCAGPGSAGEEYGTPTIRISGHGFRGVVEEAARVADCMERCAGEGGWFVVAEFSDDLYGAGEIEVAAKPGFGLAEAAVRGRGEFAAGNVVEGSARWLCDATLTASVLVAGEDAPRRCFFEGFTKVDRLAKCRDEYSYCPHAVIARVKASLGDVRGAWKHLVLAAAALYLAATNYYDGPPMRLDFVEASCMVFPDGEAEKVYAELAGRLGRCK